MIEDQRIERAKQEIRDAVMFLAPREVMEIFKELADDFERITKRYDDMVDDVL